MRALILGGGGAIASACAQDLLQTSADLSEMSLADVNLERARNVTVDLHDDRVRAIKLDVSDLAKLSHSMESYDIIINLTPGPFSLIAVRAAIQAKRNYVDLGSHQHLSKQAALDSIAKEAGITVCLGCGASPGITNVLVRYAAKQMESIQDVRIAMAKFNALAPSSGELDRLLEEFDPDALRYYHENGNLVQVDPFMSPLVVDFSPPIGRQEVHVLAHSEVHSIPQNIPGVQTVTVRAAWRKDVFFLMRTLHEVGLLSKEALEIKGSRIIPRDLVRYKLAKLPAQEEQGVWAHYLWVECDGMERGQRTVRRYLTSHPGMDRWGRKANALMAGVPASIGAQLIRRGEGIPKGVVTPEACFEPDAFLKELSRREIHVDEQVLAETRLA